MNGSVLSWLDLHGLELGLVQECIRAIGAGYPQFGFRNSPRLEEAARGDLSKTDCIQDLVKPSLVRLLGKPEHASLIDNILWAEAESETAFRAHTIDHGVGSLPEVCLHWRGDAKDLICLAHEVAHAIQIQLCSGSPMPPVARETCAFLGELALIDYIRESRSALQMELLRVWNEENAVYLGRDCSTLRLALQSLDTSYHYDLNYPLARAAAILLFQRRAISPLGDLFASGGKAMQFLPLEDIAESPAEIGNRLPPMPPPDTTHPALNAYRSLGAMVLLDVEHGHGEAEQKIEEYYASRLDHLQKGTAFIGLNPEDKPLGYATWQTGGEQNLVLQQQCAPFGDHLTLQRMLERRLPGYRPVMARHARSARAEQLAW